MRDGKNIDHNINLILVKGIKAKKDVLIQFAIYYAHFNDLDINQGVFIDDMTPLQNACYNGQVEVVKTILKYGGQTLDVNATDVY